MAFTYNEALTADRDKVRFLLSDTREESAAFSDGEVAHALTEGGSVHGAVGMLARVLLMDRARRARSFSGPEGSLDETAQIAALQDLADRYGQGTPTLPLVTGVSLGAHPSDPRSC